MALYKVDNGPLSTPQTSPWCATGLCSSLLSFFVSWDFPVLPLLTSLLLHLVNLFSNFFLGQLLKSWPVLSWACFFSHWEFFPRRSLLPPPCAKVPHIFVSSTQFSSDPHTSTFLLLQRTSHLPQMSLCLCRPVLSQRHYYTFNYLNQKPGNYSQHPLPSCVTLAE